MVLVFETVWLVFNQSHRETDPWVLTHYETKISSLRMDRKEGLESGATCVVKWGAQVHFSGVLPLSPVQETGRHWFLTRLCPHMVGVSSDYLSTKDADDFNIQTTKPLKPQS